MLLFLQKYFSSDSFYPGRHFGVLRSEIMLKLPDVKMKSFHIDIEDRRMIMYDFEELLEVNFILPFHKFQLFEDENSILFHQRSYIVGNFEFFCSDVGWK